MINPFSLKHKEFHKGPAERLSDGSLVQCVTYNLNGDLCTYQATGEDHKDLERDWAFKYLELFG